MSSSLFNTKSAFVVVENDLISWRRAGDRNSIPIMVCSKQNNRCYL